MFPTTLTHPHVEIMSHAIFVPIVDDVHCHLHSSALSFILLFYSLFKTCVVLKRNLSWAVIDCPYLHADNAFTYTLFILSNFRCAVLYFMCFRDLLNIPTGTLWFLCILSTFLGCCSYWLAYLFVQSFCMRLCVLCCFLRNRRIALNPL